MPLKLVIKQLSTADSRATWPTGSCWASPTTSATWSATTAGRDSNWLPGTELSDVPEMVLGLERSPIAKVLDEYYGFLKTLAETLDCK